MLHNLLQLDILQGNTIYVFHDMIHLIRKFGRNVM